MGIFKEAFTRLVLEMKCDVQVLEMLVECVHESDVDAIQGMKKDLITTKESLTNTRKAMKERYGKPAPEEAEKIYQHCMGKMDAMLVTLNNKLSKGQRS